MGESLLISDASGTDVDEIKINTTPEMIRTAYFLKNPASTYKTGYPTRDNPLFGTPEGTRKASLSEAKVQNSPVDCFSPGRAPATP